MFRFTCSLKSLRPYIGERLVAKSINLAPKFPMSTNIIPSGIIAIESMADVADSIDLMLSPYGKKFDLSKEFTKIVSFVEKDKQRIGFLRKSDDHKFRKLLTDSNTSLSSGKVLTKVLTLDSTLKIKFDIDDLKFEENVYSPTNAQNCLTKHTADLFTNLNHVLEFSNDDNDIYGACFAINNSFLDWSEVTLSKLNLLHKNKRDLLIDQIMKPTKDNLVQHLIRNNLPDAIRPEVLETLHFLLHYTDSNDGKLTSQYFVNASDEIMQMQLTDIEKVVLLDRIYKRNGFELEWEYYELVFENISKQLKLCICHDNRFKQCSEATETEKESHELFMTFKDCILKLLCYNISRYHENVVLLGRSPVLLSALSELPADAEKNIYVENTFRYLLDNENIKMKFFKLCENQPEKIAILNEIISNNGK